APYDMDDEGYPQHLLGPLVGQFNGAMYAVTSDLQLYVLSADGATVIATGSWEQIQDNNGWSGAIASGPFAGLTFFISSLGDKSAWEPLGVSIQGRSGDNSFAMSFSQHLQPIHGDLSSMSVTMAGGATSPYGDDPSLAPVALVRQFRGLFYVVTG